MFYEYNCTACKNLINNKVLLIRSKWSLWYISHGSHMDYNRIRSIEANTSGLERMKKRNLQIFDTTKSITLGIR